VRVYRRHRQSCALCNPAAHPKPLRVDGHDYHRRTRASLTYGLFGIVLGLLTWIYLGALTFVICAEINVVRMQRLWPRSLLTPFTDNVDLTPGDRRAYTSYAETERHKGFENVDVDFDQPPSQSPD
jgi:membrane protein